jgi:hypothetical protein
MIVRVLAAGEGMTPDQLQRAVTVKLPTARGGAVKQQLRVLRDSEYVEAMEGDARKVTLTDSGRRWALGIRALSGGSSRRGRRS